MTELRANVPTFGKREHESVRDYLRLVQTERNLRFSPLNSIDHSRNKSLL